MAAAVAIAINDGATPTPVSRVFSPQSVGLDKTVWHDRSIDAIIGRPQIVLQKADPAKGGAVYVINATVQYPILEVSAPSTGSGYQPQPKAAYFMTMKTAFMLPARSALQDRKHILALGRGFLNTTVFATAIESLEVPW